MRWVRGAGGAALVVSALALGTAWTAVGEWVPDPADASRSGFERTLVGTVNRPDATPAAAEPVLGGYRTVGSRLGPSWALPGLAVALAALCVLRRLRAGPPPAGLSRRRRAGISRRGPPPACLV